MGDFIYAGSEDGLKMEYGNTKYSISCAVANAILDVCDGCRKISGPDWEISEWSWADVYDVTYRETLMKCLKQWLKDEESIQEDLNQLIREGNALCAKCQGHDVPCDVIVKKIAQL